jgi:Holliday junction resolvasome RuvABC endonuclease subunit
MSGEMNILTLDLGTKTGWAYHNPTRSARIVSGVTNFKSTRFEDINRRFVRFRKWLDTILYEQQEEIDIIYFEEVRRHLGVDAAHAYGGFLSMLTTFCIEREIPYQGVPVGSIKKSITGKGNANKEAVIKAIKELGHLPADDNEADALAVLYYALNEELKEDKNVKNNN